MSNDKLVKRQGNFSKALRGEEPLVIGEVLQRAWEITVRGLPVMLPLVIACVLVAMLVNALFAPDTGGATVFEVATNPELQNQSEWARYLTEILLAPLWGGLIMLGILNANDEKLTFGAFFSVLQRALQLVAITFVKLTIPVIIGYLAMVTVGQFSPTAAVVVGFIAFLLVNITFMLAAPLAVHRQTSVFKSIMGSVLVLRRYFWRLFGLMIILGIIVVISMLPLFLGLLFTLPLSFNVIGVLYISLLGDKDSQDPAPELADDSEAARQSTIDESPNE